VRVAYITNPYGRVYDSITMRVVVCASEAARGTICAPLVRIHRALQCSSQECVELFELPILHVGLASYIGPCIVDLFCSRSTQKQLVINAHAVKLDVTASVIIK